MISVTTQITMDLLRPAAPQIVHAKQGEALSRLVKINLLCNGSAWEVPDEASFVVCYAKADGTGGKYDEIEGDSGSVSAVTADGSALTVQFPVQAFTCAGWVRCDVQMISGTSVLSTFTFYLDVQKAAENEISSEDYYKLPTLAELSDKVGDLSELETDAKGNLVAAINEAANAAGQLPIARAGSSAGAAYSASGDDLPSVATANTSATGHVGKGSQIIFLQRDSAPNSVESPTLALNGGEAIPIRLRASRNQGSSDAAPTATVALPVGALMSGVPYTMTFCGAYWLVDSAIGGELVCAETADGAAMMRRVSKKLPGLVDADAVSFPVVNTMDGLTNEIGVAMIERTQDEVDAPDEAGFVHLPSVAKVQEMINAALKEFYEQYIQ